jgi:hypothetical protein
MTPIKRFRLAIWTCDWVLRKSLPNQATAFGPALVTLVSYAIAVRLGMDAEGAFVTAFIMGYGMHAWLRLPGLVKGEAVAMFGPESAVVIPLILVALMVAIGQPIGCLRVYSVFALMRTLILADDLWNGRYEYVQRLWPDSQYRPSDRLMTRAFLAWCLAQIALTEIVIAGGTLAVWLAFAALAPVFISTVDRVLVKVVLMQRKDIYGH